MNTVQIGQLVSLPRIKHLWRDVFHCVGSSTFKQLEEKLNPLNEIYFYCLHRVFFLILLMLHWILLSNPEIITLSQVRKFSPSQLFIHGALQRNSSFDYPYDSCDTTIIPDSNEAVSVPRVIFTPSSATKAACSKQ